MLLKRPDEQKKVISIFWRIGQYSVSVSAKIGTNYSVIGIGKKYPIGTALVATLVECWICDQGVLISIPDWASLHNSVLALLHSALSLLAQL